MFVASHYILLVVYAVMPLVMIYLTLRRQRARRSVLPLFSLVVTFVSAIAIGVGLVYLNAYLMPGRIGMGEAVRMVYLTLSALCVLKLVDRFLLRQVFRLARVPQDIYGRPIAPNRPRALLVLLAQRLLMLAIIIPYAAGLLLSFRPKAALPGTPRTLIGLDYADASFSATDGTSLAGWWVPARRMGNLVEADAAKRWGKQTVLLCHGVGAGKEFMLPWARVLASRGYNVFLFDFRAHGESGGNFISYGANERLDVLGAIGWIKANHFEESSKIFGIGVNTGAAALLAASIDAQGTAISGIVLYEPYADFDTLAAENAQRTLPWGIRWLVEKIGVPIASLHCGANLSSFSPAECARQLWPRPVLLIHGRGQCFVPYTQEMSLYQAMSQPKQQFWPSDNYSASTARLRKSRGRGEAKLISELFREYIGTGDDMIFDAGAESQTLQFLESAEPFQVI